MTKISFNRQVMMCKKRINYPLFQRKLYLPNTTQCTDMPFLYAETKLQHRILPRKLF